MRPVNSIANPGATKLTTFSALDDEKRMEKQAKREKKLEAQRLEDEKIARAKRDEAMAKLVGQSWADLSDDEEEYHVVAKQVAESSASESSDNSDSEDESKAVKNEAPKIEPSKSEKPRERQKKAKKLVEEDPNDIDSLLRDMQLAAPETETTVGSSSVNEPVADSASKENAKEPTSEETVKASEKLRQARAAAAATEEEKAKEAKKTNAEKKKEKKEKKMLYGR